MFRQLSTLSIVDGSVHLQDSNHGVPLHVMKRTLLQEDIGLINEHDGVPAGCNIEYPVQCIIQIRGLSSEVTAAHDVERSADVLAGGLRREGLADARRAKKADDETLAFATDEVVEYGV